MPEQGRDGWDRNVARQRILLHLESRRRRHAGQPPRKTTARALAFVGRVAPHSSVETRKRRVRELIEDLRRDGVPIAAQEGGAGYWIAESIDDHRAYEAALERHGVLRLILARADRRSRARADAAGQLVLFAA